MRVSTVSLYEIPASKIEETKLFLSRVEYKSFFKIEKNYYDLAVMYKSNHDKIVNDPQVMETHNRLSLLEIQRIDLKVSNQYSFFDIQRFAEETGVTVIDFSGGDDRSYIVTVEARPSGLFEFHKNFKSISESAVPKMNPENT